MVMPIRKMNGGLTPLPQLCSVHDAAAALGRSPRTLRRWISKRMLAAYLVVGRYLVDRAELKRFLNRHLNAPDG